MKTHSLSSKRRGFTLVELLVVIAIIAALAGLAITGVQSGLKAADASKATRNMKEIYGALSSLQTEGVNTGLHAPNTFPPTKVACRTGKRLHSSGGTLSPRRSISRIATKVAFAGPRLPRRPSSRILSRKRSLERGKPRMTHSTMTRTSATAALPSMLNSVAT